jgi:hypothetical protein
VSFELNHDVSHYNSQSPCALSSFCNLPFCLSQGYSNENFTQFVDSHNIHVRSRTKLPALYCFEVIPQAQHITYGPPFELHIDVIAFTHTQPPPGSAKNTNCRKNQVARNKPFHTANVMKLHLNFKVYTTYKILIAGKKHVNQPSDRLLSWSQVNLGIQMEV